MPSNSSLSYGKAAESVFDTHAYSASVGTAQTNVIKV